MVAKIDVFGNIFPNSLSILELIPISCSMFGIKRYYYLCLNLRFHEFHDGPKSQIR